MSFYNKLQEYINIDFDEHIKKQTQQSLQRILSKDNIDIMDYLALLSKNVDNNILEKMAQKSKKITELQFGKTVSIYAPLYLSNHCVNNCKYCGFRVVNKIPRKKLTVDEAVKEAKKLSDDGIKHLLILTGESEKETPIDYIVECINSIKKYFNSISIEIYPMERSGYKVLVENGVDGITIYQETYHEETYATMHQGPKKNYMFRLETPERAAESKMRTIGVGALLGLYNPVFDSFMTALHAKYIMDNYTDSEVSVSFPRIQPEVGGFKPHTEVDNKLFVQCILATRLFLNRAGITISTRENETMRNNLIGLGITKMSAGSKTDVGGYTLEDKSTSQFDISDDRSINEVVKMLEQKGYQAVFSDWI